MDVSIDQHWENFVERLVREGRYASVSEVLRAGLRLLEEHETKLQSLRARLDASIAQGGVISDAELDAALAEQAADIRKNGVRF